MKLTTKEIQDKLKESRSGWSIKSDTSIQKIVFLNNFQDAVSFANEIFALAEKEDHHPDICVSYRTVTLALSTHSEGGVTEKDIRMALLIDKLS